MRQDMIPKFLSVVFLFFLIFFIPSNLKAGQVSPAHTTSIPEDTFDFNEVREGIILEHTFTIYNKGSKVLTIQRVKPD
ncbi:MAG: hypothetical protein SVW57_07255 [Thermodesulfobacteriota bacterium]|nr:hypothetical protein [Thermodesulfobacteriota bacterium]